MRVRKHPFRDVDIRTSYYSRRDRIWGVDGHKGEPARDQMQAPVDLGNLNAALVRPRNVSV
jgi:hypothetical protein